MKKALLLMSFGVLTAVVARAQSKVFKEVNDEISSQIRIIKQDNSLVGYLAFTQLEKASEDSFNYRVTIMDENLNDIGKLNFRDEGLNLQAVSFESDVLCLAFLKSNIAGKSYKNRKAYNALASKAQNAVVTRFLNLDGKTIQTNNIDVAADVRPASYGEAKQAGASLSESIQLVNIPGKGFTCFFGDGAANQLVAYDVAGKELWKKGIPKMAKGYYLLGSKAGAYLLSKKEGDKIEGGFEVAGYDFADKVSYDKYALKDKKGASLKVLGFDNDPVTGMPYVTGAIINPERDGMYQLKDVSKMPYIGMFTVQLKGPKKADIRENFSYWSQDNTGMISEKGKFSESDAYAYFNNGFMDFQGNTYFAGSSITKKPKWGSIVSSVVLSPLIVVSPMILLMGTSKCKTTDALLLKQTPDGKLSYAHTIPCNHNSYRPAKALWALTAPQKQFYKVSNADTKTDYVIVDDIKDIVVYNVTQGKVARTIPHKDGGVRTNVFPAKEGHVMVMEYNKKEKYTRVSIESL